MKLDNGHSVLQKELTWVENFHGAEGVSRLCLPTDRVNDAGHLFATPRLRPETLQKKEVKYSTVLTRGKTTSYTSLDSSFNLFSSASLPELICR